MKQVPNSYEAEMAILGTMLVYPENFNIVRDSGLHKDDFYYLNNKVLFDNMMYIYESTNFMDLNVLMQGLTDNQELDKIGGVEYLSEIFESSGAPSALEHYIKIVIDKSKTRKIIDVAHEITEIAFNEHDIDVILDESEQKLLNITRDRDTQDIRNSHDIIQDLLDNINQAMNTEGGMTGLKTGFRELDRVTNGLQDGDLIIIGARPSMGKTAFALNLALNVARQNEMGKASVALFSLEMPDTHLMSRMTSSLSQVESYKLRSGQLSNQDQQDLQNTANMLSQLNMFVDDSSTITIPEIFSKCRKLKNEDKLDLVVIDYLQLITGNKNNQSRQQEISEISRQLKQLAREMNVPVIALSQLSRNLESREDKRPVLSDLRESGSIEQDADIVMFLHRDDYFDRDRDDGLMEMATNISPTLLRISKNRNGALADIDLNFYPEISRFSDA